MVPRSRWALALAGVLLLSSCSGGSGASGGSGGTSGAGGNGGSAGTDGIGGAGGAPSLSGEGFVENLLERVEDGEWTLGEGLVATLRAVAGETDKSTVLLHPELLNDEATGIIAMAFEYLEDGEDEDAKDEIERLLDLLIFSEDQLNAMAGEEPTPTLLPALKNAEKDCANKLYKNEGLEVPPGVSVCLEKSSVTIDGKAYSVFVPLPSLPQGGWTQERYALAVEMINEVVPVYNGLGQMPNVNIVFSVLGNPSAGAYANQPDPDHCIISVFTGIQKESPADFKQFLAHEMAHCFQEKTFTEQNQVPYDKIKWREEGLADHLSNVVYPDTNREWGVGPEHRSALYTLAFYELSTTLFDRSYTNFLFFQYLASRLSDPGVIALVKTLPTEGDKSDQIAGLAAYPDMRNIHHDFARALTDGEVIDTSGIPIPYPINQFNQPTITLAGQSLLTEDFEPFGVSRMLLTVEADREASVSFTPNGSVDESTRSPSAEDWETFPDKVPDNCADVITVVTTVEANTGFEIDVPEVREAPGSCNLEGTWVVDNESLDLAPTAWKLEETFGEMRITFGDDDIAEVVYAGWGYRILKDTPLNVGGIDILRHEEFIHTTNATGTTPYEVDGDQIRFDEFFESAYLEGTETVRQIREFNPPNTIGSDIDETTTESADGRGLFAGIRTYELEGGTLRFLSPINGSVDGVLFFAGNGDD